MWYVAPACCLLILGAVDSPKGSEAALPERAVWDVIRARDGDFAFAMPARPAVETREVRGTAGTLEILAYSCAAAGSDYRLRRIRSPQSVSAARVIAELAHLRESRLETDARLVKQTPIVVDGVIGHDFTDTAPAAQGQGVVTRRTRHFIRDHFYYELTVASPPGRPLPDNTGQFLSSLTFEAAVRAHYARMKAGPGAPARPEAGARPASPPPRSDMKARVLRTRVNVADATPEDALKTFYLALKARDAEALRAVTLPDDEFSWLLRGLPASPSDLMQMKSRLEQTAMKRLKPGNVAKLADGESRTLKPDDLRAGRAVIWPEGSSHALRLEENGGHWKVDARPVIAARKAAEAKSARPQPPSSGSASPAGR